MIGKIQRVPIKEVWKHEAIDFTAWLRDHIDILNEAIGFELTSAETEQSAGSFNVDIVAEDINGNAIIIENQYGKTDHEHLGKVLTYFSMLEAHAAIWIVEDPRPEHVKAISWLNESTSGVFYLIKIEAVKIGDSVPAPLLTVIVGPSEEAREVGVVKKDIAERDFIRKDFWTGLLKKSNEKTKLFSNISPGQHSWIGTGSGKKGLAFNFVIRQHNGSVELYIDRGSEAKEENERIFDFLFGNKAKIEADFGSDLLWERLENRRACRISFEIKIAGYREPDKWDAQQEAMVDAMIRLEKAFKPFIKRLEI